MKDTLFRDLSKTLPILFISRETSIRFYLQVLVPAVKLATTVQTSASRYAFTFQKTVFIQFKPLTPSWFKIHKIVDIKTGKSLKPYSVTGELRGFRHKFGAGLVPRQQGQSGGDFTPDNALGGALIISTWQAQQNLRLEWGHSSLNLQFKGVRSAGDSIVMMLRRGGFIR